MPERPRTAEEWFEEGAEAVRLSLSADTRSDLQEDLGRAVAAFDEALALDPTHLGALVWRARSLERLGRDADALPSFQAASRLLPDDHDLSLRLARLLARLGRPAEALAVAESLRRALPTSADVAVLRAEILSELGRDAEAAAAWEELPAQALSQDQRRSRAHGRLRRALALARQGDPDARADLERVFDEEQEILLGFVTPTALRLALQDLPVARSAFQSYLERQAQWARWSWGVGVWLRAKRPTEALAAAEAMLRLDPTDARGWYLKGEAHAAAAQRDEAIQAYRMALAIDPKLRAAAARLKVVEGAGGGR